MKKIVYVLLAGAMVLLSGNVVSAQGKYGADSAECIKYLSYYQEYFKQKNYDESLPHWRRAIRLCPPTANQNMLINGTTLLRREIGKTSDVNTREGLIDSLLMIHEVRASNYPKYAVTSYNNEGTDLINYRRDKHEELYGGLNRIIEINGVDTKSSILMLDLQVAIELYQEGKIEADAVIATYQNNLALLTEASTNKTGEEQEQALQVKSDMEGLFITSKVASCENLITLFTPRYEANPNDLDLVTNIVTMMASSENCTNNDLYMKAVTSMHTLNPSSKSAYYLYRLHSSQGNTSDAIKYLEDAAGYADLDAATAADYNYQLAAYCVKNGNPSKAYAAAQKAMNYDSSYTGKAYYLMATVWASSSCGGDEMQARSKYWVATDYMQQAKAADSSLTDDCNSAIAQYRVYYPQTADAFMYDLSDGQSYTVSCGGLRATTTVRTQK